MEERFSRTVSLIGEENFDKLKNMFDSIKIESALIENLENEFEINEKLNKEKEEKEKKEEEKKEENK